MRRHSCGKLVAKWNGMGRHWRRRDWSWPVWYSARSFTWRLSRLNGRERELQNELSEKLARSNADRSVESAHESPEIYSLERAILIGIVSYIIRLQLVIIVSMLANVHLCCLLLLTAEQCNSTTSVSLNCWDSIIYADNEISSPSCFSTQRASPVLWGFCGF